MPDHRTSGSIEPDEITGARRREFAAVIVADVVGYVRLMESDETGVHARVMSIRDNVLVPNIEARGGRLAKMKGDGFTAHFASCRNALEATIEIQKSISQSELALPDDRRIAFRFGINHCEVFVEPDDIYGDGVNVAARLQTHSEPGGVVISDTVAEQIGGTLGLTATDLGRIHLRNRNQSMRVLSLRIPGVAPSVFGDAAADDQMRPSIAILPFRKIASQPDESYFADGIVENIRMTLASLNELTVIARGSTLGFGGPDIDVKAIGQALDVRYILNGSVQRAGKRIRIKTELIDAETAELLRADQHDGDIEELFDLQDRIALGVIKIIAPRVRDRELRRALRKHPQNMTAYDLVLQALEPLYKLDYASFARARGLLQRAMVVDPRYAPAYSYAAWWHSGRIGQSWSNDPAMDARDATRLAARAIEIDSSDALALAVFGHESAYVRKDFDTALRSFDRALQSCPNLAVAWTLKGLTLCFLGDGPGALRHANQGVRLSPHDQNVGFAEHVVGQAHYLNGDYDKAVLWCRRAVSHNDRQASNLRTLVSSLIETGAPDDAREVARMHATVAPDFRVRAWAKRSPMTPSFVKARVERLLAAGMPE